MKKIALIAIVSLVLACNNGNNVKQAITKAHIFERKLLPGNKLLISYAYQQGQAIVKDSSIIENKVLSHDSIPVALLAKAGRQ